MRAAAAAAIAAAALLVFGAATADAYVYWGNTSTGAIGRAGNEGTPVEPEFIVGPKDADGVAVDAGHVYWSDYQRMSIGRARLDGTGVELEWIKLPYSPDGVAVNGTNVYWTASSPGDVGRAAIDGSSLKTAFVSGQGGACGVAVDGGHVYWSAGNFGPGFVARVGLDGKNLETEFVEVAQVDYLCGVGVNSASVFWTDTGVGAGTNIGRASLITPKTSVDPSYIGAALGPCGIAVHGPRLYWANAGTSTIGRANTDASGIEYEFIQTGAAPKTICGVAVDDLAPPPKPAPAPQPTPPAADSTPPDTKILAGPGKKLDRGTVKFRFSSSEAGSSFECRLDKSKPRRCSSPKAYRGLKAGRHLFQVWATDAAGNRDATPAKRSFRVPGR